MGRTSPIPSPRNPSDHPGGQLWLNNSTALHYNSVSITHCETRRWQRNICEGTRSVDYWKIRCRKRYTNNEKKNKKYGANRYAYLVTTSRTTVCHVSIHTDTQQTHTLFQCTYIRAQSFCRCRRRRNRHRESNSIWKWARTITNDYLRRFQTCSETEN